MVALRYKNFLFLRTLGAHCRRLRTKLGYSIDRMSKEGDQLSTGAIQRLETGSADVHISLLYRYAEVLGLKVADLLDFDWVKKDNSDLILAKTNKKNAIPYYGLEAALSDLSKYNEIKSPADGWVLIEKAKSSRVFFTCHVYGEPMSPLIKDGALVLFKKFNAKDNKDGKVLALQAKGLRDPEMSYRFVIREYKAISDFVDLVPQNTSYSSIRKNKSDVNVLAEMVQVIQNP